MHDYEIYLPHGFCESEWEYKGKVQALSENDALIQARQRWHLLPAEPLIALIVDSPVIQEPHPCKP